MLLKSDKAKAHEKAYKKELYHWYRDHGICFECKRRDAEPGRMLCAACKRERALRAEHRDPGGEKRKAYLRERYARLKAEGLCVDCGRRKAQEGHVHCARCLKKKQELREVARIKKRIWQKEGREA